MIPLDSTDLLIIETIKTSLRNYIFEKFPILSYGGDWAIVFVMSIVALIVVNIYLGTTPSSKKNKR